MAHELSLLLAGSEVASRTSRMWGAQDTINQTIKKGLTEGIKFDKLVVNHASLRVEEASHAKSQNHSQDKMRNEEVVASKQSFSFETKTNDKKTSKTEDPLAQSEAKVNSIAVSKKTPLDATKENSVTVVPFSKTTEVERDLSMGGDKGSLNEEDIDPSSNLMLMFLANDPSKTDLMQATPNLASDMKTFAMIKQEGDNILDHYPSSITSEEVSGIRSQEVYETELVREKVDDLHHPSLKTLSSITKSETVSDVGLDRSFGMSTDVKFQTTHKGGVQADLSGLNSQQLVVMQGVVETEKMKRDSDTNSLSMVDIFTQDLQPNREIFEFSNDKKIVNFEEEGLTSEWTLEQDVQALDPEIEDPSNVERLISQKNPQNTEYSKFLTQESSAQLKSSSPNGQQQIGEILTQQVGPKSTVVDMGHHPSQFVAPVRQVALQLQKAIDHKIDRLTLALDPEHLGKVEVELKITTDKHVQAIFNIENAEAYDLLKRDSHQLQDLLRQAGLDVSPQDFTFNHQNPKGNLEQGQQQSLFLNEKNQSMRAGYEEVDQVSSNMSRVRDLSKTVDTFI